MDSSENEQQKRTAAHICVCVCTYRRPELLRRLLEALGNLERDGGAFDYSCVVVDNDDSESARAVVEPFITGARYPIRYDVEPQRNIALVRNRAVKLAEGDFVAFIDDDEVPRPEWLANLLATQRRYGADGVLGPVRPYFDATPPAWIVKGKLCERPAHVTGTVLHWRQTRTGNVLMARSLVAGNEAPFNPVFASGGEDVDFFRRAIEACRRFVWCEEAPAYELVPPARCRKSYFLKRGLLLGRISLKHGDRKLTLGARIRIGLHSALALVIYTFMLPVVLLGGFHRAMIVLIKSSHHLGRVFAIAGVDLMRDRSF